VDHFTQHLPSRVANCWNLFGRIFELIDKKDLSYQEAKAIKDTFFGREIKDILGNEENQRSEKHEPANRWSERLHQAGFTLRSLEHLNSCKGLLADDELEIAHNIRSNFFTTRYRKVPLVAMFVANADN
jgi:hypothetical protein